MNNKKYYNWILTRYYTALKAIFGWGKKNKIDMIKSIGKTSYKSAVAIVFP